MKLKIIERITLLDILPKEGNFNTLKTLRKLKENISLSEEEVIGINVVQDGNRITWDNEKAEKVIKDESKAVKTTDKQ